MSSSSSGTSGALVGQRLGKYEILALLALGGTAEIYLARIGGVAGFEKHVVVKTLHDHLEEDQEFVRMFRDEARLGAQLTHSNIVQMLELGEHNGRYYMVMEYLAGMSMSVIARKAVERCPGGVMPAPLVMGLLVQACSGLHYSHTRKDAAGNPMNIVHRDVSPQNLVVTFDGNLKVVDYGIAKAAVRETKTQSGTIKGKFAYMSPEQCVAGTVDQRTDVFALGIVLYELLTGKRLFKRESAYDTYHAILQCKVPTPSQMNRALDQETDRILLKALAHQATDRYDSAEALGDALQSYLHRNGHVVNAGTVSKFFDQYFDEEIQEHGERMRALISGRNIKLNSWDEEDDSSSGVGGGGGARGGPGGRPATSKILGGNRSQRPISGPTKAMSATEPSEVLDASDLLEADDDDDGDGATQIESDPLERIRDLALQAARAKQGASAAELANSEKKTMAFGATDGSFVPSLANGAPGQPAAVSGRAAIAKTLVPGDLYASNDGGDEDDEDAATLIADRSINVQKLLADAQASVKQQQAPGVQGPGPGNQGYSGPSSGSGPMPNPSPMANAGGSYGQPNPMQRTGAPQQWGQQGMGQQGMGQQGMGQQGMGQQGMGQQGMSQPIPYGQNPGPYGAQQGASPQMYGAGAGSSSPTGSQPEPRKQTPTWMLAATFLVCAGIGFGVTLFVASLL